MRSWVSLSYLLCRILDTVEDARWDSVKEQTAALEMFDRFIKEPAQSESVGVWQCSFPKRIPEGEALLIRDVEIIFRGYHQLSEEAKNRVKDLVLSMSKGMREFLEKKKHNILRLNGMAEVNLYCYYVAGLVGEALSQLAALVDKKMKVSKTLIANAHHFGLFLQKVNLLKDQVQDEKEGRFFVPSREELYLSLKENARGAMSYIESLPLTLRSYRVFCLWSFFLGLKTLPLLKEMRQATSGEKIGYETINDDKLRLPREQALDLFAKVEAFSESPDMLRLAFSRLMSQAHLGL